MEDFNESSVNAEAEENVVDSQETEQVDTAQETVNADNEEVANPQAEEKPVQSKEENAMYAKIRKEAEAKAMDKAVAEMGMEWNGKPITTWSQYQQAKVEAAEAERRKTLEDAGYDPSVIDKYVSDNPIVKKAQEMIEKKELEEFKQNNQIEFLDWFENQNGRKFDASKDVIPAEVWQQVEKYENTKGREGKSLVDAYAKYENKLLKQQIAEFKKGIKTAEINSKNAAASTGSTTGNGANTGDFISKETFEANKKNSEWLSKNYDLLKNSMNKW